MTSNDNKALRPTDPIPGVTDSTGQLAVVEVLTGSAQGDAPGQAEDYLSD
jgi:hypothetical protein